MISQFSSGGLACPHCSAQNPPESLFCAKCGVSLAGEERALDSTLDAETAPSNYVCPRCQVDNEPGSAYCYSCGLRLDRDHVSPTRGVASGNPAGFWIRLVAMLIDLPILLGPASLLVVLWPETFVVKQVEGNVHHYSLSHHLILIAGAGQVLYYVTCVSVWSTTIGKRLLGLYVLRPDGSKIGPGRALVRWIGYWVSSQLFWVGYLMIAFRSDKRGLHDIICGTVVVRP